MLKIWGRRNSINVQKVMWTVAELGLPHQRIDAGMSHGLVNEPWYREQNPNGLIPTIDDGGVVLWESNVIVRYLAAKHAPGTLMPTGTAQRAKAEMWMDWQQNAIMPGMSPLFLGLIRTPPEQRDLAAIRAGAASVENALRLLDAHLQGKTFMIGDHLTVADIPLGCVAHRWFGLPIAHVELPHLSAWHERLSRRPGFAEHVMLPLT